MIPQFWFNKTKQHTPKKRCAVDLPLVCLKSVNLSWHAGRVVLGGGVPWVGPQEELRGPSGYTLRGFTSRPRQEAKQGFQVL